MADNSGNAGAQKQHADRGHPMPRRASPETSITLQHHRLGREASRKASLLDPSATPATSSPRRDSSGESHDTGHSDPKTWFDRSNRNPTATFNAGSMDVDPPFFQKETASSIGERKDARHVARTSPHGYTQEGRPEMFRRTTQSSSAEDYRSVIDDLTIENKRLKEELKRYKQFGSDMMRKDKLFEIKVHGLPGWRKRELEATLRDFAANLDGDGESRDSPSQHRKSARHGKSLSKQDSSSSSRSRPVDSAYASMSTGRSSNAPNSTVPSIPGPSVTSRAKSSQHKVENYLLPDTPEGLLPRRRVMTDKEKKKFVVRRLEQIFTGKIRGRNIHRNQSMTSLDAQVASDAPVMGPPRVPEAAREAYIQQDNLQKKTNSRDNFSTSNSNGDQTESGGNGMGSGDGGGSGGRGGSNTSPPTPALPEQRPTRILDLDPDRVQNPSENINYMRHLGLVPNDFLFPKKPERRDVSAGEDGWVYLNLLINMAQLHMISVTPAFVRSAVTEKSSKFQLSPDGQKIRWRGGTVGTKFSSDSSGENSQKSPSTDETDGSNGSGQRKRQRTMGSGGETASGGSSKESKFGPQQSHSSNSFHYKPLFVRRSSSLDSSVLGTTSQPSDGGVDDSNLDQWDYSGSGSFKRKRRRNDGAIIYYSGAPFCTDLSGDVGELSPTTYLQTSTGQEGESIKSPPPLVHRTLSGSSLPIRPLSDPRSVVAEVLSADIDDTDSTPNLTDDDEDSPTEELAEFPWCDDLDVVEPRPVEPVFEACGLGGVIPEDHFAYIVTTRRTIAREGVSKSVMSEDMADAIASRLASMRTSSPLPLRKSTKPGSPIETKYLAVKLCQYPPVALPPPAVFLPPFSSDSDSDLSEEALDSFDEYILGQDSSSAELFSQRVNPHQSDVYPEIGGALSSEEEVQVGSIDDDERKEKLVSSSSGRSARKMSSDRNMDVAGSLQSSVATAGDAESGYSSSVEDNSP